MDYLDYVNKITPKEKRLKNMFLSFISGGIIGIISFYLTNLVGEDINYIIWIGASSILTGLGVFDKLANIFKMGLIIPITGFSHSITSAMIDYKKEGFITGIGSNYFKLAGSVILYGIVFATLFALIKGVLCFL